MFLLDPKAPSPLLRGRLRGGGRGGGKGRAMVRNFRCGGTVRDGSGGLSFLCRPGSRRAVWIRGGRRVPQASASATTARATPSWLGGDLSSELPRPCGAC